MQRKDVLGGPGKAQTARAAILVLVVLTLALAASCRPDPVTQSLSKYRAVPSPLLIVSEMREEGSTVWAVNPANLTDRRVLGTFPHQPGFPIRGAISPDELSVALVQLPPGADRFTGARLLMMNSDGTGLRTLEEGVDYDVQPPWSPDSRELAFVKRPARTGSGAGGPGVSEAPPPATLPAEVYAIGLDGKDRRILFSENESFDLYLVGWHRDGNRLIYRRFTSAGDELWVYELASGGSKLLSNLSRSPAYGVRLAPDGASIAASVRRDDSYEVVSQALEGQGRRVLSRGNRRPSNTVFAHDGRRLAFDTETQQGTAVGIMEAGAETITRLSSPAGGKEVPLLFSPDGQWLLVRHHQDGRARVLILRMKDGAKEYLETAYWVEPIGWTKG